MAKIKPRPAPKLQLPDDVMAKLRVLSRPEYGGLQLHVWPLKDGGFQGNVAVKSDGPTWAVHVDRTIAGAIHGALDSKMRVVAPLTLAEDAQPVKHGPVLHPTQSR